MWAWTIGGLIAWALAALFVAVVLGRVIRQAERNGVPLGAPAARARAPRRRVPLPPVGVGLAVAAVGLESIGYVLRLTGATGGTARLFDMDAPYSLPRMYVAALFAAAALAAVAGAARNPGRRTWWLGVGTVAAVIAVVKAGSTLHAEAMAALVEALGMAGATAVSALAAVSVLLVLGFLSRAERRDRRRVLTWLGAYAGASVGLSAVSAVTTGRWQIAATFVEESGEALAGVAVLVAVLIGVAPRLVLPPDWALRRRADAQTLDVPAPAPRRAVGGGPLS